MPDNNFLEALKTMEEIHRKKNEDYSTSADPYSNFKFAQGFMMQFPTKWAAYTILIGVKLARLSVLLMSGKKPNNESIEDTFIDLANYILLWRSAYMNDSRTE